jgi:AraC-like DNA-binding protein
MQELYKPFQPLLTQAGLERFDLSLQQSPACNILKRAVHSYLQISTTKPTPYPMIPDGTQAIFISSERSMIGGTQTQATEIQILKPGEYFGIRFYPGALRYFFNLSLFEITDQFADSRYFPCREFGKLHHNIYEYQSFKKRAEVCEHWLLKHFNQHPLTQFDHALSLIYQSLGNIKVSQLSELVGWSSRHLNRLFHHHTGLNTKTFAQTIRIQNVCKQLYTTPADTLSAGIELGFFDQSHLIKEFNKRLLSNPSTFFNRFMSDFYNH